MAAPGHPQLDALDVDLLAALRAAPRAGVLELSRLTGVARATVQARLTRLAASSPGTGPTSTSRPPATRSPRS